MHSFWADHWWLLIPLRAFSIPLAGIAMGAFATWLHHQSRNRALDALKIYAKQGREPPEALLHVLGDGDSQKRRQRAKYYAAQQAGADLGAAADAAANAEAVGALPGMDLGALEFLLPRDRLNGPHDESRQADRRITKIS